MWGQFENLKNLELGNTCEAFHCQCSLWRRLAHGYISVLKLVSDLSTIRRRRIICMASSSVLKLQCRIQEVGGGDRVACCRHCILVRDRSGSLREKCVLLPLRQLCVHYKNQVKVLGRVGTGCSQDSFGPWWPANPTAREVLSEPSKSSKALAKSHLWKWRLVEFQSCCRFVDLPDSISLSPSWNQQAACVDTLKSRHGFLPWRDMASNHHEIISLARLVFLGIREEQSRLDISRHDLCLSFLPACPCRRTSKPCRSEQWRRGVGFLERLADVVFFRIKHENWSGDLGEHGCLFPFRTKISPAIQIFESAKLVASDIDRQRMSHRESLTWVGCGWCSRVPKKRDKVLHSVSTGKESTGKDTDKAKCAKQIATSLQIPFETGVAQSDPRWYVDLLCLTIYCSSRNFHITPNGNCTCGIGIIVFQQFWTRGSFATIDSCAAVEVVQKATFLPGIRASLHWNSTSTKLSFVASYFSIWLPSSLRICS